MLYGMARRYDDLRGEAPDGGSSLRGALKGWFKHGACRQALWPKLDEPVPTGKPDWWDDGVRRPLGAYYRVDARSVVDMQLALNETSVLLASALAHDGWNDGSARKGGKKFHTTDQDLEELAHSLLPSKRVEWNIPPGAPIDVAIYAHGGGMQLMELLAPEKNTIRLHLVGHSAATSTTTARRRRRCWRTSRASQSPRREAARESAIARRAIS
jgi:hypothetical protein